jgi:HEAT repeat protein
VASLKSLALLGQVSTAEPKQEILALVRKVADSRDEEPVVRIWALMGTIKASGETSEYVSAVAAFLRNPDAMARAYAAKALAALGPKAASTIPQILRCADDRDPEVVLSAVEALAAVGDAGQVIPVLEAISQDTTRPSVVRQTAEKTIETLRAKAVAK